MAITHYDRIVEADIEPSEYSLSRVFKANILPLVDSSKNESNDVKQISP